jgi:hypothetical protein
MFFQTVTRNTFIRAVEETIGRKVVAFSSATNPDAAVVWEIYNFQRRDAPASRRDACADHRMSADRRPSATDPHNSPAAIDSAPQRARQSEAVTATAADASDTATPRTGA